MTEFRLDLDWQATGDADPHLRDTSAWLAIRLGDACLTRNLDAWSRTVRDNILVSAYPLAMWLAASWWRLSFEPLPAPGTQPDVDWRMAHELGAANHGYVWPRVVFAADGQSINVWAHQTDNPKQSANYLCNLDTPRAVLLADFQLGVTRFIEDVIYRAEACDHRSTDLAALWAAVREDMSDERAHARRTLEAELGFEPEECPAEHIAHALRLQDATGTSAMSELVPIFGKSRHGTALDQLEALKDARGLMGAPQITPSPHTPSPTTPPWQQGMTAARALRKQLGNCGAPINNAQLLDLLGITQSQEAAWQPQQKHPVGIAKPTARGLIDFLPRKRHPIGKRFELARLVGECMMRTGAESDWLVESDLATATQKRQRAFAAELLCPIDALVEFLDGDYSESAQEDAADHFEVSETTIAALLANNACLPIAESARLPYRVQTQAFQRLDT